jgi:hypothetical protein
MYINQLGQTLIGEASEVEVGQLVEGKTFEIT